MAAPDLTKILTVPGSLCFDPTDLTTAFPHGGTALGAARAIVVEPRIDVAELPMDEHGDEPGDLIYLGQKWRMSAVLRGSDQDAAAKVWPVTKAVTGSYPTRYNVESPGTAASPLRAGNLMASRAVKLLFSPDDTKRHLAVLFYRAILWLKAELQIKHAHGVEWELEIGATAIRRSSDSQSGVMGLLGDLTL